MKTIPRSPSTSRLLAGACFTLCFVAGLAAAHAAPPSVQALGKGRWLTPPNDPAVDVKVAGQYAYIATRSGLSVIDVSDPARPLRVGGHTIGGAAENVAVSGNYAYVADFFAGLVVIDVSNPTNCVRVGGLPTLGWSSGVAVAGNYAYVADGFAYLQVIDVSNPTNCVRVGSFATFESAVRVAVAGHLAYVADGGGGMEIVDVSDPTNCQSVGTYSGSGDSSRSVVISGNYACMVGGREDSASLLEVIDVSDPGNPWRVSRWTIPGTHGAGRDVAVSGNMVYVTGDWNGGLHVLDISNPSQPVLVGSHDTAGYPVGMAVADNRIYMAGLDAGLLVLPTLPNVQFTVRVDAQPGVPFTLEAATHLNAPIPWTPLLTTNVPAMPFDYVDFDVKLSEKPHKFYRVRQP